MSHPYTTISATILAFTCVFFIFIILLQRGRGGGLAGAFGGAGGQSAFGTKAGDVFTRITIGVAIFWVAMAALTGFAMTQESSGLYEAPPTPEGAVAPKGDTKPNDKKGPDAKGDFETLEKDTAKTPANAAPKSSAPSNAPAGTSGSGVSIPSTGTTTAPATKGATPPAGGAAPASSTTSGTADKKPAGSK